MSSPEEQAAVLLGLSILTATSDSAKRLRGGALESLTTKPLDLWEFFLTSACLALGTAYYQAARDQEQAKVLTYHLITATQHWRNSPWTVISDFHTFMGHVIAEQVHEHTAVGWWVAWNIKGAALSDDELAAVSPIGATVFAGIDIWRTACGPVKA